LSIFRILAYISSFSLILPISFGLVRIKTQEREGKLLIVLLFLGMAADFISRWWLTSSALNPIPTQVYTLAEFLIVMIILLHWQESKKSALLIKILIFVYTLFWGIAKISFEPIYGTYIYTGSFSVVVLSIISGYTFFIILSNRDQSLLHQQKFWILLSFIFIFSGILMPILFEEVLFRHSEQAFQVAWTINSFLTILSNVLFTVGFLCHQTRT
jgi:hypothetical protein